MAIPEQQLTTWSQIPSSTELNKMQRAYELIKKALEEYLPIYDIQTRFELPNYDYEAYLQGSYANDTYIRFNSDIDVVVQFNSTWFHDLSELDESQKALYKATYPNSKYDFVSYKNHIYAALQAYFGKDRVVWDDKCLRLKGTSSIVNADIVPALTYKKFKWFYSAKKEGHRFIEGIKFLDTNKNIPIINYPKLHKLNLIIKNRTTTNRFKTMVRIVKNMKVRLVENGVIEDKLAPSYFIENLVYNTTDNCYRGNYTYMMSNILQQWFDDQGSVRLAGYRCANGQDSLFGQNAWNIGNATKFILETGKLFLRS